ncbi:hypothetical protein SAMN05216388_1008168 [Halorientalis persicus]|uniref:Uncharacterized protein n=1 Tax=Halorientalis persicus TaxID=1367881 RepID=A0A1H8M9V6_9EURY|nr:hypothetical protein [Halorientalis persicus]SEO14084.1 hypothetical protein SAMN05216388_1008168 [Halorientalis persicus]
MRYTRSLYRSLVGTYFALVVGPFAATLAGVSGLVDPWISLAVAGLVAGGLGYLVGDRLDVERLATSLGLAVPPVVLPLGYLVWLIALLAHNPGISPLTLLGRPATLGVLAVGPAVALVELGTRSVAVSRIEAATVLYSFQTRPDRRERRITYGALAVGLGAVAGLLGVLVLSGQVSIAVVLGMLVVVPLALAVLRSDDRTVVVTDAGVAVDGEFTGWDDVDSFTVGEDSLVVRPRGWFTDVYRLDLSSGPDPDQLQSTFEAHAGR